MSWHPHATVAVIVEKDGKFLFVEEHSSGQVVLNQPAGHIEDNESFVTAAKRETLEETAWHVEPEFLIGLYVHRSSNNNVTYHRTCYYAKALEFDANRKLDDGIIRAIWLSRDEIAANMEKLRSPMVLKCVDDYLKGNRYPLELINEQFD